MSHWKIDGILAHFVTAQDIPLILAAAEECRGDYEFGRPAGLEGFAERGFHLRIDKRAGRRVILGGALLRENVRYSSRRDQSYCIMGANGPEGNERIHFKPVITVTGTVPPVSVVESLGGRHATCVIDHPALRLPSLIGHDAHINTRGGVPTGFGVFVPQVLVPLEGPRQLPNPRLQS